MKALTRKVGYLRYETGYGRLTSQDASHLRTPHTLSQHSCLSLTLALKIMDERRESSYEEQHQKHPVKRRRKSASEDDFGELELILSVQRLLQ